MTRTIEDMNDLVRLLDEEREKLELLKQEMKTQNGRIDFIEQQIMEELVTSGLPSFKSSHGMVTISNRFNVKFPEDPRDRADLKEWFIAKGEFDANWSINYQKLNAIYKAEVADAEARGTMLDIPGLHPVVDKILSFRRNQKS